MREGRGYRLVMESVISRLRGRRFVSENGKKLGL